VEGEIGLWVRWNLIAVGPEGQGLGRVDQIGIGEAVIDAHFV